MAVIKIAVPKTPMSAFNKHRLASGLLLAQLEHLETAAGYDQPAKAKRREPLTEAQVAARIHELTRTLHPHSAHVKLPTARMLSHADYGAPAGGGSARPRPKAVKKSSSRKRGRKTRGRS